MDKSRNKRNAMVSKMALGNVSSKKQLTMSVISLILAFFILVSATYCWYAIGKSTGKTNNVNLTVGNGLRVNDLGDTSKKFKDDSYLQPASSVDGRNLFFPADGTDFSKETYKMTFRSANAGDRNYNYVQLDFNLTAEANYTGIYLDKSTSLKIEVPDDATEAYKAAAAKAEKAIRMAIYYDRMDDPVIFTSQMNPCSVNAVKDIDRTTGRFLESGKQVAYPFKDYSYGKRQLAMLKQGETRPFSLIIWLEGTDEANCVSEYVMLKQLVLNLKFTTSWDNTVTITFEDNTQVQNEARQVAQLLQNHPEYSLVLDYTNSVHKISDLKFTMQKVTADDFTKWQCNIPDNAVNDLKFQILDGANNDALISEWKVTTSGGSTLNRGTAVKYFADTLNGTDSCGHWHDGDIDDHGEGKDDDNIVDDDDW